MRQQPTPLALLAASGLALGTTLIGCTPGGGTTSTKSASSVASLLAQGAAAAADAAAQAAARGDVASAVAEAEKAVGLSPRDAGYRSLLGNLYLKAGRFDSAEQAFTEVLLLNPGDGRAALSRALAQIALGDPEGARTTLANAQGPIAASDLGLATALAGDPVAALGILEPAARAEGADGRVRQNLALAHALAGQWDQARVVGAQDVSPADLPERLATWAEFARPDRAADAVPSLLGVTRAEDPGRPERLALIVQPAAPVAVVETAPVQPKVIQVTPEPEVVPAVPVPAEAVPVAVAEAPSAEAPPVTAPTAEPTTAWSALAEVRKAARAPVRAAVPTPELVRAALAPPAKPSAAGRDTFATPTVTGRYVVQLGAYSSLARVEQAWTGAVRRYGRLGAFQPSSTGFTARGETVHRLSVSGFPTSRQAQELCLQFRRQGGSCFVRASAGDRPIRMAGRATGNG